MTIRAYDSTYSTDPDDVHLVRRMLIAEFPTDRLTRDPRTVSSSSRDPSSTHNPSFTHEPSSPDDYAPQKPIEVRP